jgi:hypothetical protein
MRLVAKIRQLMPATQGKDSGPRVLFLSETTDKS